MKILVTGATGFVGRHLVPELINRNHRVSVLVRDDDRLQAMDWTGAVDVVRGDIEPWASIDRETLPQWDALVHLAWPGLANFRDLAHFELHAASAYRFIKRIVEGGCKRVVVSGTCLEYGMQDGLQNESLATQPELPYALGKDMLRRSLELLAHVLPFELRWARLYYMHGRGQNPRSLLAQLDAAIDRGDATFNMSGGEQIRDYLSVHEVARGLAVLTSATARVGIVNVCSGKPISVRRLVEQHLEGRHAKIQLNLGHYPYPDYEPFAFWGDNSILKSLENPS